MGRVWRTALVGVTLLVCGCLLLSSRLGQRQTPDLQSPARSAKLPQRVSERGEGRLEARRAMYGNISGVNDHSAVVAAVQTRVVVTGLEDIDAHLDRILLENLRTSQQYMASHPRKRQPPRKLTKSDLKKEADLTDRAESDDHKSPLPAEGAMSKQRYDYNQYGPGHRADTSAETDHYYDADNDVQDDVDDDEEYDVEEDDDGEDDAENDDEELAANKQYGDVNSAYENEARDGGGQYQEYKQDERSPDRKAGLITKPLPNEKLRLPQNLPRGIPGVQSETAGSENAVEKQAFEAKRLKQIREIHDQIVQQKQKLESLRTEPQSRAAQGRLSPVSNTDMEDGVLPPIDKQDKQPGGFSFSEFWSRAAPRPQLSTHTTPSTPRQVAAGLNALFSRTRNATHTFASVCADVRRPSADSLQKRETWQVMRSDDETNPQKLYLYSAYYDARTTITRAPVIRIFIVVPAKYIRGGARCMLWFEERVQPVDAPAVVERLSRQRENILNNVIYSMYMLVCRLPADSPVPRHVTITRTPCGPPRTMLPVRLPDISSPQHDFGVCVVGQWGAMTDQDAVFLVEWLELHKMFGVGEVNIYNISMRVSGAVQHVMDHYKDAGFLRVYQQRSPVPYTVPGKEYDSSQLCLRTTLNDCLQRNAFRYKYMVVVDRDEIIVPRVGADYKAMMQAMLTNEPKLRKAPAIIHYNGEFFMNLGQDPTQPYYIVSLSYFNRTVVEQPHYLNYIPGKSFVNTKYCAVAWNHHCQIPWKPKVMAPRRYSLVHHYRKGCAVASRKQDVKTRNKICADMVPEHDDFMMRMRTQVQSRVDAALSALRLDPHKLLTAQTES